METFRTEEVVPVTVMKEPLVPAPSSEEAVQTIEPGFMRHHERVALMVVGVGYALFALFWFRGPAAWLEATGQTPFSLVQRFLFLGENVTYGSTPLPIPSVPWMLAAAIPPALLLLFPARENRRSSIWDFVVGFASPLSIACFAAGIPFSFLSIFFLPWGLGLAGVAYLNFGIAMVQLAREKDRRRFRGRRIGVAIGIWTLAVMVLTGLEWVVMAVIHRT
jgi:hypothetical protein